MKIEVTRYCRKDGWETRYWAVLVDGELLAVTLYRKGAEAVARALNPISNECHGKDHRPSKNTATSP